MKKLLVFIVFMAFCIKSYGQKTQIDSSDTLELNLSVELCSLQQFSFCSNGFEQFYRSLPLFVNLDTNHFLSSYNSDVYMINPQNAEYPSSYETCYYSGSIIIDSLITKKNTVSFYNDAFKKKVLKSYKKNRINRHFDGYFNYATFKIKFTRVYSETIDVWLPDMDKKAKNRLVELKKCKVYYFDKIISISPVGRLYCLANHDISSAL